MSCSSCGRPICPDCMTPTPVGMRCPECAKQRTKVTRLADSHPQPIVTMVLIAINVAVFIAEAATSGGFITVGPGWVVNHGFLSADAAVNGQEYWRMLTSGFMHQGIIHLAMNMLFIWILGRMLEPVLGSAMFLTLYLVSLLCGSAGSLLLEPGAQALGASGAAFGLLGAAIVMHLRRGLDLSSTGLLPVLVINLVVTFSVPGIAIGAHLGGVAGGFAAGWLLEEVGDRAGKAAGMAVASLLAVVAVAVSVAATLQT